MDSMRHLSTSLPRSSRLQTDADSLAAFKAAALSVTNLYKSAQTQKIQAREAGYQDCCEDLLEFLDRRNIGLGDGEGWAVREWIQSRLDETVSPRQSASEDEEDNAKPEEPETRQSSPEVKKSGLSRDASDVNDQTDERSASEPATTITHEPAAPALPPSMHDFSFRSATQLPTNHDREGQMEVDGSTATAAHRVTSKSSKSKTRRDIRLSSPAISLNMTSGTGSKRKLPYPDFFDIGNLNFDNTDRRDNNSRGGKRSRHI